MVVFKLTKFLLKILLVIDGIHPVCHRDFLLDVLFSFLLVKDLASELYDSGILGLACELFVQIESWVQSDPRLRQHLEVLLDGSVFLQRLKNQVFKSLVFGDPASIEVSHRIILQSVV